jgi:hypothetical protein
VYRRILGPVYDREKENWRILTNREIYASVKKPTIIDKIRLNILRWFGHVQRMEDNRIPKRVLNMILELYCLPFSVHVQTNVIYLTSLSLLQ